MCQHFLCFSFTCRKCIFRYREVQVFGKERAREASAKHAGVGVGRRAKRAKRRIFFLVPHPLPCQVSRFALASGSLAILSACSTTE